MDRRDEIILGSHQNRCFVFRLASACTPSGSTGIRHWTRLILFLFMVLIGRFLLFEKGFDRSTFTLRFLLGWQWRWYVSIRFWFILYRNKKPVDVMHRQKSLPCDMAGSDGQRLNDRWWWLVTCSSCFSRGVRARDWDPLISVTWNERVR